MPQIPQTPTLLMPKSPSLRPTDPRYVAGSATARNTLKRTAKSSRHSKTVRRVHFHRKPGPERPQTKETKRRKKFPDPPVPLHQQKSTFLIPSYSILLHL